MMKGKMMNHLDIIKDDAAKDISLWKSSKKVFLACPSFVFLENEGVQFDVFEAVSNFLTVPFSSIKVVGSAHTGLSYHKGKPFIPGESDLDLAVISPSLFMSCVEKVYIKTKRYRDGTGFVSPEKMQEYKDYILKGIFRPDLMPSCDLRAQWSRFFGILSSKHSDLFSSISISIYASEVYFYNKQMSAVYSGREYGVDDD